MFDGVTGVAARCGQDARRLLWIGLLARMGE
ncbi:MAG: hypothetical protein ACJAZN_001083, partial [Planctomycetota bacterium]